MAEAQSAVLGMEEKFEETKATNDPVKIAQAAATYSSVINTLVGLMCVYGAEITETP